MRQAEPIIKIPGKYTKNKKPHTIPLYHPELRAMVAAARTHRNPDCPFLFQHRGKQLKDMRSGFQKARKDAGVPELIFHDTRRTAVRKMVLAVSQRNARCRSPGIALAQCSTATISPLKKTLSRPANRCASTGRKELQKRESKLGDSDIGMNGPRVTESC